MTSEQLIQQIGQALADLKAFAEKSGNTQLLDHVRRLEESLASITAGGDVIKVGDISGSTAVAIGHDINIIVNQVLPPDLRQPWETLQGELSQAHPEVKALVERRKGGHIFLSYSRHDMEEALKIRRALEEAGHIVWQDLTAIKGGAEWIKAIEEGVERGYALVTVVSESSQKSEWVQIEYLHAKRRSKPIIPIKIDASEIPTMMLATNVIHGHPDLEGGVKQLLEALPAPPPEGVEIERPTGRRELEMRYLDRLLLEHSVWQEVYTPMAGVGQMRVEEERKAAGVKMRTAPTTIDVGYLGQKLAGCGNGGGQPPRTEEKHYEADIIPAVEEMRRLVILGDPGAGKTTTLWKILSDYATAAKADPACPLPVFVQLGALGGYDDLETAIKAQLGSLAPHYEDLLGEKRLAFLLDGLNELPAATREANLTDLKTLIGRCQKADLVASVTCRELDYTGALDLGITERVIIKPLDPLRIRRFVNAYIEEPPGKGDELFWQLAGGEQVGEVWQVWEKAGASFELFWSAEDIPQENPNIYVGSSGQDDQIWRKYVHNRSRSMLTLASNPYILFMMTQVFTQMGTLPRNRSLLFQTFVDYLLERRERLTAERVSELKLKLADMAYAMQAEGEGTTFQSAQVKEHLKDERCLYHARSANILSGGEEVRFTHQLLQEYFAAYYLRVVMESLPATELFPPGRWWESQGWEETLILLAGLYSDDCTPVIDWLKNAQPEVSSRCIVESGAYCPDETLVRLRSLWIPRLTDLWNNPQPRARAAVGRALGGLCLEGKTLDNRKGIGVRDDGLPDIDWVKIPAGEFIYQDSEKRYELTFYIARYPVTYAQFRTFIDDEQYGFKNPQWWEGLAASDEHRSVPGEQRFRYDNHPAEHVSWYDAVAFCKWMTDRYKTHPDLLPKTIREKVLSGEWIVMLLTEWQWEKAARGGLKLPDRKGGWKDNPACVRAYPYEGESDPAKGNTWETGIGRSSAVGIFPQGASPYGILDMSGNVWEWCLNEYGNPRNARGCYELLTPIHAQYMRGLGSSAPNMTSKSSTSGITAP
jgi:formylglycine-generating enzyme required for sulfatase activity